ncbi:endoribonuclease L-PSP [Spirochaetia bacterium]|nr:endoribonuclease L-PSP [Spirochaetia bacterium]
MIKVTNTAKAPAAVGPYSQAVGVGGFLFASGQIPLSPETGEIVGADIGAQAEQSAKNVGAVLEANGIGFDRVVKATCFLTDMADFAAFNKVYEKYFVSKPARSCVAVKQLPRGALCEIEVIAALQDTSH